MAFNILPTGLVPGYTYTASNMSFPISVFPEITAAEASATSGGDIRKILYGIMEKLYTSMQALNTVDRSTKMLIGKSSSYDSSVVPNRATHQYTITFINDVGTQDVAAE